MEKDFVGWAVAAAATRVTETRYQVRVRPFTIATFHREDAEQYARTEVEKDCPSGDGWSITVSAKPVMLITHKGTDDTTA